MNPTNNILDIIIEQIEHTGAHWLRAQ